MRKSVIFLMLATLFAACTKDRTEDVALTDGTKIYATIADMEGADGRVQLNDKKQTSGMPETLFMYIIKQKVY